MDKNVGSLDLEELKRAREELNRERGIENDPNMYNNYNPNRAAEEAAASKNAEQPLNSTNFDAENSSSEPTQSSEPTTQNSESEVEIAQEPEPQAKNFDVYDNFSEFEVNSAPPAKEEEVEVQSEPVQVINEVENNEQNIQSQANVDDEDTDDLPDDDEDDEDFDLDAYLDSLKIEDADIEELKKYEEEHKTEENSGEIAEKSEEQNNETSTPFVDFTENSEEDEELERLIEETIEEINRVEEEKKQESNIPVPGNTLSQTQDEKRAEERSEIIENSDAENAQTTEQFEDNKQEESSEIVENSESEEAKADEKSDREISNDESNIDSYEEIINLNEIESSDDEEPAIKTNVEHTSEKLQPYEEEEQLQEKPQETRKFNLSMLSMRNNNFKQEQEFKQVENEQIEEQIIEESRVESSTIESQNSFASEDRTPNSDSYPKIADYNFVDLIKTNEFERSQKMTYVFGKDEKNRTLYMGVRDMFNTAIFGPNNYYNFAQLSGIMLSLALKNTIDEINFVILDANLNSEFDIFNKSKYMFFNRVAKTNNEIYETLKELVNELNDRYEALVGAGVRNLEQYNALKTNPSEKLPNILIIYSNYTASNGQIFAKEIDDMLETLLKLGRIVGINLIISAYQTIESEQINYNLAGRIAFMTKDEELSEYQVGSDNLTKIIGVGEFLYVSFDNDIEIHLKVPNLSKEEASRLIEQIENKN